MAGKKPPLPPMPDAPPGTTIQGNWEIIPADTPLEQVVDHILKKKHKRARATPAPLGATADIPPKKPVKKKKDNPLQPAGIAGGSLVPVQAKQLRPLTENQEQFCREYIKDLNGTRAAIAAKYSAKSAKEGASRLLTKGNVIARISELKKQSIERVANTEELESDADTTLAHLRGIAHSNIADYMDMDKLEALGVKLKGLSRNQLAAISKIKIKQMEPIMQIQDGSIFPREVLSVEIALWDKNKAIDTMMRHLGLINDKPVEINITFIDKMIGQLSNELRGRGINVNEVLGDLRVPALSGQKE